MSMIPTFTARGLSSAVRFSTGGLQNFMLSNVFARSAGVHATSIIDYGKMIIKQRKATYSKPLAPAVKVAKSSGKLMTVEAPRIRHAIPLSKDFFDVLNPALASFMGPHGTTPQDQVAEKILIEQQKLRDMIETAIEVQCAQGLSTGYVVLDYFDEATGTYISSDTVDFQYTGSPTTADNPNYTIKKALSGTSRWDQASSQPLNVIDALALEIQKAGYQGPLQMIGGAAAIRAFENNKSVKEALDNRRTEAGSLNPVAGALFRGRLTNMPVYRYVNGYQSRVDDSWVDSWPTNRVVICPEGVGMAGMASVEFGPVWDRPTPDSNVQYIAAQLFSTIERDNTTSPATDQLVVESNPVAVIKDPSWVRVIDVLAAE